MTKAARRDMVSLPREAVRRIDAHIRVLAENPRPAGAVKLQGKEGFWRVRVGDYRILYRIENERLLIVVIRVGHRKEVYRER